MTDQAINTLGTQQRQVLEIVCTNSEHAVSAGKSDRFAAFWTASVFTTALLASVTLAFCQGKPITPEKAMMMGYVEDFFKDNARDVTMRKSLEWSDVKTDEKGNRTIRYKFEALIWDKERLIICSDFTFNKEGNCVSMVNVEGFPQPAAAEKSDVTSLEKFLNVEGLKRYPVNKRIADFPADKIDLSTPEASYATQKNLIMSNRKDKYEQLSNMTQGRPAIPERERRGMDNITEEHAKTYREQFVVFETFILNDKHAFVFGRRLFDNLYDGNFFVKEGGKWLNKGNTQSQNAEQIAKEVQQWFAGFSAEAQRTEHKTTNPKPLTTIEGVVTLDGQPLRGVVVVFLSFRGETSFGVNTMENGQYAIPINFVADANEYRVLIKKLDIDGNEVPDVIKPMYTHPATTPFSVTIKEGNNRFDIDLTTE